MTAASAAREVAVSDAELITFGLVMEEAQRACAAAVRLAESERARAEGLQVELDALSDRLGAVIRASVAGERRRIRELADRNGAVCTGDEGTSCHFSALIGDDPDA